MSKFFAYNMFLHKIHKDFSNLNFFANKYNIKVFNK